MNTHTRTLAVIAGLVFLPGQAFSATAFEECVVRAVMQGSNDRSAAEIRTTCEQSHQTESSAVNGATLNQVCDSRIMVALPFRGLLKTPI